MFIFPLILKKTIQNSLIHFSNNHFFYLIDIGVYLYTKFMNKIRKCVLNNFEIIEKVILIKTFIF